MLALSYYLLKVIICSAVLFGYYWLALRNKIFHQYNRFYLLAAVMLSLLLPVIKIDFWESSHTGKTTVIKVLQAVSDGDVYLDNIIVSTPAGNSWTATDWAAAAYGGVALVMLLLLFQTLFVIYRLLKKYPKQQIGDISLVSTDAKSTPFSFLNYIFWNRNIDAESVTGKQIFKHEVAHIQEKHTYDKLFMNLVLTVFWCNPAFWLLRRELNMIHEFIADKKAVEDSDTASFAAMILQAAYPQHQFSLANNFFYSPIKRRLAMLVKNKNPRVNYWGRILVLPLAVLVFAAFTFKAKKAHPGDVYSGEKITVVIDAGHGGGDHGAKAKNGTLEKEITLAIAKEIRALNTNSNIEIVLTKSDDIFLSKEEKTALVKKNNASMYISIHTSSGLESDGENGFDSNNNTASKGLRIWVPENSEPIAAQSRLLGSAILGEFINNYRLPVQPELHQRRLYTFINNPCPSLYIETAMISNPEDMKYVTSEAGKEIIAKNILAGIEKFAIANFQQKQAAAAQPAPLYQKGMALLYDTSRKAKKQNIQTYISNNTCLISADTIIFENALKKEIESAAKMERLVIVNGKEFDCKPYPSLRIVAKMARGYGANNKEAIGKYGAKAGNGVLEFYDAVVEEPAATVSTAQIPIKTAGTALVVIDGRESGTGEMALAKVNTENIDHIYVLKNEKALEKYGTKGANGVIEIYTKNEKGLPGNVLYVVDDAVRSKEYLNSISPEEIKTINVIRDETGIKKYGEQAKNGVVEVITKDKANQLQEVVVEGYPLARDREYNNQNAAAPAAIALDRMNVLYIGLDNPITVTAYDIAPENLVLTVTEGRASITGKNGKYNVRVTAPGLLTIGVMEKGKTTINSSFNFRVKRLPDPVNGELPADYEIKNIQINPLPSEQQWQNAAKQPMDSSLSKVNDKIFTKVDIEAAYPGGMEAWRNYLLKKLDPGIPAKEGWPAGTYTIVVEFIVKTDGSISAVFARNRTNSKTAQHCVDLIKNSGKWKPAIQNGHVVNAYRKQPITFMVK
ncbi:MAG: N-acetylmuramoyl-L-alanine amidase [Ferruginibacter sp.]